MVSRIPLSMFFVLVVFCAVVHMQGPPQINQLDSTTFDSTEIVIKDSGDQLKKVVVMKFDDLSRPLKQAEYSAPTKSYYVGVELTLGKNTFDLAYEYIDGTKEIKTVIIERTTAQLKTALIPRSNLSNSTVAANQTLTLSEPPLEVVATEMVSTTANGPNTSSDENVNSTYYVKIIDSVRPLNAKIDSPPRHLVTLQQVPPTPTAEQKKLVREDKSTPITTKARLIFGFEQVGASSASSKGQPFVDLLFNIPVGKFKSHFDNSLWTSFKLTSAPNQTLPDLGGLTSTAIGGFFGGNQAGKVNDLVQAFDMRVGWETTVGSNFSLIAGVGATSPLTSEKTVVSYKIPRLANNEVQPDFKRIFGPNQDFTGLENLILTSGDRDRFMRNWFVGGRLRHQIVGDVGEVYPAVFELTFGQDEVLTNKLVGRVLKFDSFVPIPIKGLKFLYFGASFNTKLTRKVNTTTFPFFLEPATNVNIFANNNFIRNVRDIRELNSDRDGFSFRFGVDLLQILNNLNKEKDSEKKLF